MIEDIHHEMIDAMENSLKAYSKELSKIRTGRASLSILDGIRVDYYGTSTPLNQMATLSVPESRLIVIQPYDANIIGDIERAILKSDLGLNPNSDGRVVRIAFPPLTEDRRKDLVKLVKKMNEDCKIQLRHHRREANEMLKELEKSGDVSEDDARKGQERVQKTIDEYSEKADEILKRKEQEIMEV
ncbi:MAG: ribosome recycling factor [Candidatus Alcyoniella australis]|nr:ribosome recycling factor [Candidatus Alcyoniella australis]